jgi:microcystin-dependent protein
MDPFVGEIRAFAGSYAPQGWLLCQGQTLPVSQYQALFSLIGFTYGGNGSSNFQLPNLQGRAIVGAGVSQSGKTYNAGLTGGVEQVTLTINNLPAHTHGATSPAHTHGFSLPPHTHPFSPLCDNDGGSDTTPAGEYPGNGGVYSTGHSQTMGAQTTGQSNSVSGTSDPATVAVAIQPAGLGQPVATMGPFAAINYMIAYEGIYPPHP